MLFLLNGASAKAEDKRFSMDLRQMGSQVQVTIENQGRAASGTMALEFLFDGESLQRLEVGNIPSSQIRRFLMPVPEPRNPGSAGQRPSLRQGSPASRQLRSMRR